MSPATTAWDFFLVENYTPGATISDLADRFVSLGDDGRTPYYQSYLALRNGQMPDVPSVPCDLQTLQERNPPSGVPISVRTYYGDEGGGMDRLRGIVGDATYDDVRYDGMSSRDFLCRIPQKIEAYGFDQQGNQFLLDPAENDTSESDADDADSSGDASDSEDDGSDVLQRVLVIEYDREAQATGWVKVTAFGARGEVALENRIKAGKLGDAAAAFSSGVSLAEHSGGWGRVGAGDGWDVDDWGSGHGVLPPGLQEIYDAQRRGAEAAALGGGQP
ncbi:carbohydrate-binding protein [Purpureocillium lavendulum]|uniref:Carbohydrate-binding protein n=1 Tax=Purpureocillium lavendulum TaxID=1247861 RepID=A0AB34G1R6_9HYPO|nr:carbohydrate-binding protein [Purpureocillium lavendulum]